jgi:hypothetical protein
VLLVLALAAPACAPKLATLPTGPGSPFPEFSTAYQQATASCRDVRTMAAVLQISGRAAGQRFPRASIDAGFEAPDKAMLELPAPGRPIFTFAASGGTSTLILARDGRVLQNAPPEDTLEALTGIRLGPADLRAIVSGCGFGVLEPVRGRSFDARRAAVDADQAGGSATAHLERTASGWQLVGMIRGALEVRYTGIVAGRPSTIRLRTAAPDAPDRTDLTIRPSQVDINQPIQAEAFAPEIPPGATPLTLDELRKAGPLGR